jgi:hypothetical protein
LLAAFRNTSAAASGLRADPSSPNAPTNARENSTTAVAGLASRAGAPGSSSAFAAATARCDPVELLANFGRRDLRRLADVPAPVHVHVQAALLEPVDVLRECWCVVEYLSDLAQGHGHKLGRLASHPERHCGDQLARYQLQLVPLEHSPDRRPRPQLLGHGR